MLGTCMCPDCGQVVPAGGLAGMSHDAGVVHRDIKPENILVDRQGRVKVADFGLAKLVGADEMDMSHISGSGSFLTEVGQVMGTPQYMAPEQIAHPSDVDHRADIYSLGIVLYQMLTGELPGQVIEPPSHKAAVDVRLDEVVLRALEKRPEDRYQQASEVKESVETILSSPISEEARGSTSMEITFHCPGCDQKLAVDSSAAGAEVNCPSCSQAMLVPAVAVPPPLQAAPPPIVSMMSRMPQHGLGGKVSQGKGWAIWALVLGLIGLVPAIGLATGVLGLGFGIVALVKKTSMKGLAIGGTIAGALAVVMIPFHLVVLKGAITGAKFGAQTVQCSGNLHDIGEAISEYRAKNGGVYPANLQVLVKEGLLTEKSLKCPMLNNKGEKSGYGYMRPNGTSGRGLIAWDLVPHTAGENVVTGRNVLDANLKVRFVKEVDFKAELEAGRSGGSPPVSQQQRPSTTGGGREVSRSPVDIRKPVTEGMSVGSAVKGLKSASAKEMRPFLQFLLKVEVEGELRGEVIGVVKPLLNDVDHGDVAFQVFAKWADKEQVQDFIEMLRVAPNSWRGKECMKILSRKGDARAAGVLAECLKEFHILRDAKAALAALGSVAKPGVLPYYHSENGHAREAARELLRGYGATDEEILEESLKALGSAEAETRRSAVEYLGKAKLADDERVAVASEVRDLILDTDDRVKEAARTAMKTLATVADADFLLEQMSSRDEKTMRLATELLIQLKDMRVAKPLAEQLADPQETYRAGGHLITIGSGAEGAVIPYLRSEDAATRRRAADVLAKIGTRASVPALEVAAKDSDFFAKAAAESALGAIKGRSTGTNRNR
jgi:HEAT repeat protein